jgi:hypothetical protein
LARRETHPRAPEAKREVVAPFRLRPGGGCDLAEGRSPFISAAIFARFSCGWMDGGCASHVGAGWSDRGDRELWRKAE